MGFCSVRLTKTKMTASNDVSVARFPISFDRWYRILSYAVGLPPSSSYLDLDKEHVQVRMGWAFRARFPRSAVMSVSELDLRPLSRGVHGFGGRWLVNGSGHGIVRVQLRPPVRGYLIGFPLRLQELLVSVVEPSALATALLGPP